MFLLKLYHEKVIEMDNREYNANCAWYLYRMMGPVIGATQKYVGERLIGYSIARITCEAEDIQQFYHHTADKIQSVLVGKIEC